MKEFFLSDELTPHPLVLAIIAIAIAVMCLGGCSVGVGGGEMAGMCKTAERAK